MATVPTPAESSASPREVVLRSAWELFAAHGIRAVGVDAIVERAGVRRSDLYRMFPSKDGLVAEVLRRSDADWLRRLSAGVAGTADPADRLRAVFDVLAEWFAEPGFRGSPFLSVRIELASEEHPAIEAAAEHVRRVRAFLAAIAREAGAAAPDELAAQLQQVMKGAIVMAMEGDTEAAAIASRSAAVLIAEACPGPGGDLSG